jgi:histone H3/H4
MPKTKKTRYFDHHISNIIKEVCPERDITQEAKTRLNELGITTCKIISNKILEIIKKKTITELEVEASIKLVFEGQLCQKSIEEGKRCLQHYLNSNNDKENKENSKKSKADLLIPPSMLEKFLRSENSHRVSESAPIFLAGIIEYFLAQVIELASISDKKVGVRITCFDIKNGIESDQEINRFIKQHNIYIGTKDYVFPKTVVEDSIKNYMSLIYPEIRFQKDCFSCLHDYIEKWMVDILQLSNHYSKKERVSGSDIDMVLAILEKRYNQEKEEKEIDYLVFNP